MSTIQQILVAQGSLGGYSAYTAIFDGTDDYLSVTSSPPVGLADGKAFTLAFWLKMGAGSDGTLYKITSNASNRFTVERTAGNLIRVLGQSSSSVTQVDYTSTNQITVASGWTHVYICFDSSTAGGTNLRKVYFNGSAETPIVATFISTSNIDAANTSFKIGASSTNTNRLNGSLAEMWIDDTYFDDPTKFYSGGHPISLGSNGSTPTGSAPAIYLSRNGSGNSWATDSSGNGNNFTVTGALGTDASP